MLHVADIGKGPSRPQPGRVQRHADLEQSADARSRRHQTAAKACAGRKGVFPAALVRSLGDQVQQVIAVEIPDLGVPGGMHAGKRDAHPPWNALMPIGTLRTDCPVRRRPRPRFRNFAAGLPRFNGFAFDGLLFITAGGLVDAMDGFGFR